jgi:uncharacterized phage protein gp47/JayE
MAIYIRKNKADILREELSKLERDTPIKATAPGSISRAFAEAVADQLADVYDALDFNLAQSVLSTATGNALDLIGSLYDIKRKTITDMASIDRKLGAFYFYIDSPHTLDINIPTGTKLYTRTDTIVGRQISYETVEPVRIAAGNTRVFCSIRPTSTANSLYTAAPNTLTVHDFMSPATVIVKCNNPKAITPQEGYESDANYRSRVMKQIRVASSGTLDAIRFTALSVPGVREAKVRQTPYGLGSFELLVVPEEYSNTRAVLSEVTTRATEVRPVGVRMYARLPDLIPLELDVTLILSPSTPAQRTNAQSKAKIAVARYLNSLLPGDTLVYTKLIQYIMDSSERIKDAQITRYAPNAVEAVRRNYQPKPYEQLIPGSVRISVA